MSVLHNFQIEKILGERSKKGHKEYHIKWVGYDDNENTWEPEANLIEDGHQKDLDKYNKAKKKKVKKKKPMVLQVIGTKSTKQQIEERRAAASADGKIIDLTEVRQKNKTTGRPTSRPYTSSTPRFKKKSKPKKPKANELNLEERIRARMARSLRKANKRQRDKKMLTF